MEDDTRPGFDVETVFANFFSHGQKAFFLVDEKWWKIGVDFP